MAIGDASAESKELITLRASLKRMDELVSSYETQLAEAENTINYYESLNVGQEIQQYKQKITTYQQQITIYEESIERYKK